MSKKAKKEDWEIVARQLDTRNSQGKTSKVLLDGQEIPQATVTRCVNRSDFMYQRRLQPYKEFSYSEPRDTSTLSYILVRTPSIPTSPIACNDLIVAQNVNAEQTLGDNMIWKELIWDWSRQTPWSQFIKFINASASSDGVFRSTQLLQSTDSSTNLTVPRNTIQERFFLDLTDTFFAGKYARIRLEKLHKASTYCRQYCLPRRNHASDIDERSLLDSTKESSQLEILKLIVKSISDNMAAKSLHRGVVALLAKSHNRAILQRLLQQRLYIVDTFAERLLLPAVEERNLALVRCIVENGASVVSTPWVSRPLYKAIICGDASIVALLLEHGANVEGILEDPECDDCTPLLDVAAHCLNFDVFM